MLLTTQLAHSQKTSPLGNLLLKTVAVISTTETLTPGSQARGRAPVAPRAAGRGPRERRRVTAERRSGDGSGDGRLHRICRDCDRKEGGID